MRATTYTDNDGRRFQVLMPDDAPESHARYGVIVGPQVDLSFLKLPQEVATRIHNALFDRNILTYEDARSRLLEVRSAVQAALGSTVEAVIEAYQRQAQDFNDNVPAQEGS